MNAGGRFEVPAEADSPDELAELGRRVAECRVKGAAAADELEAAFGCVVDLVGRRRRILNLVQEALSQLRLDVKYLMFDLEVTRRERDELRARLEEIEREF